MVYKDTFAYLLKVMKNILIPTDFSENSKNATLYAMDYFIDCPMHFHILHVSSSPSLLTKNNRRVLQRSGMDEALTPASVILEEEVASFRLLRKNPDHQFSFSEMEVPLIEAIRNQVKELDIDLIVMGTKGNSGLEQDEMGSNTYEVITKVKCPILVVPEYAKMIDSNTVAFITDYNNIYRNKVITTLSAALNLHKSPLRILHLRPRKNKLTPSQVDNKGFLHYFFRDTKHTFHFLENQNVETGIQEFVDDWEITIVALAAKNLNFIQRLMLRPTSETITYHTRIPFLVLHE